MKRAASKYGNVPTVVDGHRFPSKAEARRYGELKLLERAGQIQGLKLQPLYPLRMDGVKVGTYTPDFEYVEAGQRVAEDVKGAKPRDFAIRSKLFRVLYPDIELRVLGA